MNDYNGWEYPAGHSPTKLCVDTPFCTHNLNFKFLNKNEKNEKMKKLNKNRKFEKDKSITNKVRELYVCLKLKSRIIFEILNHGVFC